MEIWIVILPFSTGLLSDHTYSQCLKQLDGSSQARVKRFYHREDAWRSLTGMLLPRALLRAQGIPLECATFSRFEGGKPYVVGGKVSPGLFPAVGYNISHDDQVVAMVSHVGNEQDVNKIGIDVMKRALPKGETVSTFLRAIHETLTETELEFFTPELDNTIAIRYIFLLWTLKEAYTKALGLGLGFDFKRIEYDIPHGRVFVDGRPANGWEFLLFVIHTQGGTDAYQGAVARWVDGEETHFESISNIEDDSRICLKGLTDLMEGA